MLNIVNIVNIVNIILVVVAVWIVYGIVTRLIKTGGESGVEPFDRSDLLLTDYYKRFVPSSMLDNLPKHMRIHHSGNPMYTSNKPPTVQEDCHKIECPPLVEDDITPNKLDHYDPFPQKSNRNLTCWSCRA